MEIENSDPVGFTKHDHNLCIKTAVAQAEAHCKTHGLRMTPVRKRVFEILLDKHKALGAYDILDVLREEGFKAQPPVAYRALEFLVNEGFAHRIEQLNAFVACTHPGADHSAAFLICKGCDLVAETEFPRAALSEAAARAGFVVEGAVVEARGLCAACRENRA